MRSLPTLLLVKALSLLRRLVMLSDKTLLLLFLSGFENLRWQIGKMKAYSEFRLARKKVPAYKDFLAKQNFGSVGFRGLIPMIESIPIMDKSNYVQKYTIDERCLGGKMPGRGIIIDESSGSTGMPTNWARGSAERKVNKRMLEFGLDQLLGKTPKFIINAFALGP
ncbi:MAG: hypothetical protein ABI778_03165, partial [Ignavibacteriota bacterium]